MASRMPRARSFVRIARRGALALALMGVACSFACSSSDPADDGNYNAAPIEPTPPPPPPDPNVVSYQDALAAIDAAASGNWYDARDAVNAALAQLASRADHQWRVHTLIARTYESKRLRLPALYYAELAIAANPGDAIARGVADRMRAPLPTWGEAATIASVERLGAETDFALYRAVLEADDAHVGDGEVAIHDVVVPSWLRSERIAAAAGQWGRATIDSHPMNIDDALRIAIDGDAVTVTNLSWDTDSDEWIAYAHHPAETAIDIVAFARRVALAYTAINLLSINWPVVPARWYIADVSGVARTERLLKDVQEIEAIAATFNRREWVRARLAELYAYIAMDAHVAADIRAIAIRAGVRLLRDNDRGGIGDVYRTPRATAILALLTRAFPLSASAESVLEPADQQRLQLGELMADWHQDSYIRKAYWEDAELHLFTNTRGAPSPAALHHLWLAQTSYGERVYTLAVQTARDTPIYHTLRYDYGTEVLIALNVGQPPTQQDWRAIITADIEALPIGGVE